jgi:LysR family cys regulon transcriptional activator
VAVKSGVFLRDYVYVLLEMLSPELTREVVHQAIERKPALQAVA